MAQGVGDAYAVLLSRDDGTWQASLLPAALSTDLDALIAAVRQQPAERSPLAFVDVADEFFVVVRVQHGRVRLLLSDASAAVAWELAAQVLEHLGMDAPAVDDDEVWAAGDLGIFDDLGLQEMELSTILADEDAYADEMLGVLARRLGFGEPYERVVDAVVR
ncbi:MAG TPA: tRNA adenosine deaminase-associated protein [Mycobacteriales bacterium]|nr:tRNA adenosine deaminase-associated protein [Mycobacteriales bacterium]